MWASSKVGLQSLPCMPPCSPNWLKWWWLWASLEVTTDLVKREELCQAKPLNNCAELGCPPTSAPAQQYYLNKKQTSHVTTHAEVCLIQVAFPDWYNGIGLFQVLCTPFHRTSARAAGPEVASEVCRLTWKGLEMLGSELYVLHNSCIQEVSSKTSH